MLHILLLGYLLSLFLAFDLIIFLRVLSSRNAEKQQFIRISTITYELIDLLALGIGFELFWMYAALYIDLGPVGDYASAVAIMRLVIVTGIVIINILAFFMPLQELVGITRINLRNLGIPGWMILWGNKYILIWRKGGKAERFYGALLVAIRYVFWLLLISIVLSIIPLIK